MADSEWERGGKEKRETRETFETLQMSWKKFLAGKDSTKRKGRSPLYSPAEKNIAREIVFVSREYQAKIFLIQIRFKSILFCKAHGPTYNEGNVLAA